MTTGTVKFFNADKGYGFIEVVTDDLNSVIDKTNDSIFQERTLKVRPAKDKVDHE